MSRRPPRRLRAPRSECDFAPTSGATARPRAVQGGELAGAGPLFPGHRVVAFYGAAGAPALGVLGDAPPGALWARLGSLAASYGGPGVVAIPAYELIAFAAQATPGSNGSYTAAIPASTIEAYLSVVRAGHGMLILDIQPGRSSFLDDAEHLAPFLALPDVGLALDPEWELAPGQLPLQQLGHTSATQVNAVSRWLSALVERDHLPEKLFLIHEFDPSMVEDKSEVTPEPGLATVFNMDGYGTRPDKVAIYDELAADHRFAVGFKLFYGADTDLMSPNEVLALRPVPSVIEYE